MGVLKNKAAQDMARKRAESLTPARRQEIAKGAAKARWGQSKKELKRQYRAAAGGVDSLPTEVVLPGGRVVVPEPRLPRAVTKPAVCTKHKLVEPCRRCQ